MQTKISTGQKGFTLIEVLIALIIMIVVLGAIIQFSRNLNRTGENLAESAELNERRASVSPLLEMDFARAGHNFFSSLMPHKYTGEPLQMKESPDFLISQEILKDNAGSAFVLSGNGFFGLRAVGDSSDSLAFEIASGQIKTLRRGAVVATESIASAPLTFEIGRSGNLPECLFSVYQGTGDTRRLVTRAVDCPAYPLEIVADRNAAPISADGLFYSRENNVLTAAMPLAYGLRQTDFVVSPPGGGQELLLFGADTEVDAAGLTQNATVADNFAIQFSRLRRGSFRNDDGCLLIDFDNNRTLVGKLTQVTDSSAQFTTIFENGTAAARLAQVFSTPPEYNGVNLQVGAKLVRLQSTLYRVIEQDGVPQLVRRENDGFDSVVANGLKDFHAERLAPYQYAVTLNFLNEGIAADQTPRPVRYIFKTVSR